MRRAIYIVIIAAAITLLTVVTINTFLMEGIRVWKLFLACRSFRVFVGSGIPL